MKDITEWVNFAVHSDSLNFVNVNFLEILLNELDELSLEKPGLGFAEALAGAHVCDCDVSPLLELVVDDEGRELHNYGPLILVGRVRRAHAHVYLRVGDV